MRASQQVMLIVKLIQAGKKVKWSGGRYCIVDGRQFPSQHLNTARDILWAGREAKRAAKNSQV